MLTGLITIAGGILAASALIIARKPNAKDLIDKLTPYQGWIGVVMFVWGLFNLINIVMHLGFWMASPLFGVFALAATITSAVVGFLLGFGLITKYALGRSPVALARGQQLRAKLAGFQGVFGLIAIALGSLYTVLYVTA
jgi:hypothetical protein